MTEGQAVPKPDQSAPTPEEAARRISSDPPGTPILPILTRLYHAAKMAGKIEAHEQDARGGCDCCDMVQGGYFEPIPKWIDAQWRHLPTERCRAEYPSSAFDARGAPCDMPYVHDALAALKSGNQGGDDGK